jgi:hypothetical protein
VVSRNRCVALGRPRWDSSGAGAHRPVTAFGRSRRCTAGWVLSSLVLGAAAERFDRRLHRIGRRRRIPTPPAVTRSGRGARLDSGYESGRRCGHPASRAASHRTAASRREGRAPKQTPLAPPPDDRQLCRATSRSLRNAREQQCQFERLRTAPSREKRSWRCYSPGAGAAASANGLPSESLHTAHRSPGWMIEPPSSRTRSSVVARSATVK